MKKFLAITGSRSDYGLLYPLLKQSSSEPAIDIKLVVTGSHLHENFGSTLSEIENDDLVVDATLPILNENFSSTPQEINIVIAKALEQFSSYLRNKQIDAIIVLGDRYEIFAAAVAALNLRIPIIHIAGGQTTHGAIDDCFRHCISNMASLHFVSHKIHQQKVMQLVGSKDNIIVSGALGIDNIYNMSLLNKSDLLKALNFPLDNLLLITVHPVTRYPGEAKQILETIFSFLDKHIEYNAIFTGSNADCEGSDLHKQIINFVTKHQQRVLYRKSLGKKIYLSLMRFISATIGNSSSGIIEVPCFRKLSVNMGNRQAGRLMSQSVVHVEPGSIQDLENAIRLTQNEDFQTILSTVTSPYGDGQAANRIIQELKQHDFTRYSAQQLVSC